MSYIRFTAESFDERQVEALSTLIEMFCDTVVNEDDDNDCTYYETELGESYEFALPEDLDEAVVEAIVDSFATWHKDFTVEATGQ